jgi:hypothetical protein
MFELPKQKGYQLNPPGGILYRPWILPAAVVVLFVGLAYIKFLIHLPSRTRWLFLIAGAVFVFGAIGSNTIDGVLFAHFYDGPYTGAIFYFDRHLGEFSEMLGIAILIHALLDYMRSNFNIVNFYIGV